MGDSLFVELPRAVLADSVQVSFTTRVLQNATVFVLDLGASDRPGLWQSVEPAERRSNLVMLPDLPGGSLIGDLSFSTPVLTPNGDGINDEVEVRSQRQQGRGGSVRAVYAGSPPWATGSGRFA